MATINEIKNKKFNNDFITSIILILLIMVIYVQVSHNIFILNKQYSIYSLIFLLLIVVPAFILSIMLHAKYGKSFNNNLRAEDLAEKKAEGENKTENNIENTIKNFEGKKP
ncbi:MAG: hypothetical protein FWD71_14760 [Oscillospiraceae bacterium]|nr:hypothetical protein [Oscillospiraceae bacterium]